jgi:hypothetical protein
MDPKANEENLKGNKLKYSVGVVVVDLNGVNESGMEIEFFLIS